MSYARVDFVREEDSSQPTRRFRATRSAAPTPPESPASFFPSLRLCLRNLVGKHTQLPLVEHSCIHHANQHLFDRTVAEPVDDALDGFRRNPSAWLRRMVDIGSPIHRVRGVALVFQPSQHGPNGRFLQRTRKPFTHGLGRHRTVGPNQLHYLSFEVTQCGQAIVHLGYLAILSCCNATERRTRSRDPQRRFDLVPGITNRYCGPSFETATS